MVVCETNIKYFCCDTLDWIYKRVSCNVEYEINNLENLHTGLISSDEWFIKIKDSNFKVKNHVIEYEKDGQKINGKDYSNQEGCLTLHLTK